MRVQLETNFSTRNQFQPKSTGALMCGAGLPGRVAVLFVDIEVRGGPRRCRSRSGPRQDIDARGGPRRYQAKNTNLTTNNTQPGAATPTWTSTCVCHLGC